MTARITLSSVLIVLLDCATFANYATVAEAQTAPTIINFDEKGNGTVQNIPGNPNSSVVLENDGNNPDSTDPSSGLHPLTYNLRQSAQHGVPVTGDVLIAETAGAGVLSDLLRFTPDGYLLVYSDLPESGEVAELADVGIPTSRQNTLVNAVETGLEGGVNGLFNYTPTPNQPGYIPYFDGAVVIYNFTSDVPEPAAGLFLLAALGIALNRSRRSRG